jgi:nucleoporin NUP159
MPGGVFKNPSSPLQSAFSTPSTGGFSAFASGGGGGFSAFAGAPKSFGELLKSTGDEAKESPKTESVNVFSVRIAEPETPVKEVTNVKVEEPLTPATPVAKVEAVQEEETPIRTTTPPLPVVEEKAQQAKGTDKALPLEPSLESISSSTASSFVDVSAEDAADGDADSTVEESDEDGELEDDTKSFISDDESEESEESELPDDQDEQEEEREEELEEEPEEEPEKPEEEGDELEKQQEEKNEGDTHQEERTQEGEPEPTVVPSSILSPAARSRSTTPKAELPTITLSTSPSPPPRKISPVRDQSTTPPGSPVPEAQRATPPVVSPLPKPPASSPFAITPRTTGTRPAKSSPLANAPLTGDVEAPSFSPQAKSAPPTMVPHPASPRPQFGSWVPPMKQDAESDSSRPKTPPVLFGKSASASAITALPMPPAFTLPPNPLLNTTPSAPPSIFGAVTPTQSRTPTPPVFTPPPTGFLGFSKPSESGPPSIFGAPVRTPEAPLAFTPPPPGVFGGFKPLGAVPSAPVSQSPGPVIPATPPPSISPPAPPIEQGMQSECSFMVSRLTWELDNLKTMAARATQQTAELGSKKTPGQSHVKADLADATKWAPGDIKEYGHVMTEVQGDIKEIKEQRKLLKQSLKELESSMLKAGTRKEEIIRFTRAQTDSEFAKMLKIRTLGPEYLETQSQLRRDIRTMRDRVQKLEDHLQSSKKRLAELKAGKPSLKAPSLDTVNRTFRNIDISITQQSGDVAKLQQRMSKLDISSNVLGSRDKRLLESGVKKPAAVIPHVAVTTAAALNAERSAQKLKRALLAVRKEPLLNNKVASKPAPTSFLTPSRAAVKQEPNTPTPISFISLPSSALPAFNTPTFTKGGWSPETSINYDDSTSYTTSSSRRPQRTPRHGSSAKSAAMLKSESLEASPTPAPKAPAAVFDWGPLPIITPKTTLSADVRPKGFKS